MIIYCADCDEPIPAGQIPCVNEEQHQLEHDRLEKARAEATPAVESYWCEPPCVLPRGHIVTCWDGDREVTR